MVGSIKLGIIFAILSLISGGFWMYSNNRYDHGYLAGYDAAETLYKENEAKILEDLNKEKEAARKARKAQDMVEIELQELLNRPVPIEVRYEKIHCDDYTGVIKLWNHYADLSRDIDRIISE